MDIQRAEKIGKHLVFCLTELEEHIESLEGTPIYDESTLTALKEPPKLEINDSGTLIFTVGDWPPKISVYPRRTKAQLSEETTKPLVRDRWFTYVEKAVGDYNGEVPLFEKSFVFIKFVRNRSFDPDNFSVKFIIDALRFNNVITSDSCEDIYIFLCGEKKKGSQYTEICVQKPEILLPAIYEKIFSNNP